MSLDFILQELNYFRSQCYQERRELQKALAERDWRMTRLAESNLAQAQRQFLHFTELLTKPEEYTHD